MKPLRIHLVQQTSPEWWQLRCGKATASSFDKIITAVKGERSKSGDKYCYELCADRAMPTANYFSKYGVSRGTPAMQHGQDFEAKARDWYAYETGNTVQQIGFVESECGLFGCSPDGVIGLAEIERLKGAEWPIIRGTVEGCLELKCPQLDTHFEYVRKKTLPNEYKVQVHGQLVVTGARYVDFVSYSPDTPKRFLVRVEPDDFTRKVEAALLEWLDLYRQIAVELAVELTPPAHDPETGEVYEAEPEYAEEPF